MSNVSENKKKQLRIPPQSKEAEMMVLGSILTTPKSLTIAVDFLKPSDFFYREHQTIFGALKSLYKKEKPVDLHILCEELKKDDNLEGVGGPQYIATLAQYAGTSAHIEEYCNTIRMHAYSRQQIELSQSFCAGTIIQKSLFNAYRSTYTRSWTESKDIYTIEMREGNMQSLTGNLELMTTKGDIHIEGHVGSEQGDISLTSAQSILLSANIKSAENRESAFILTPTTFTHQTTTHNTTQSSLPHLFAGGDVYLKANQNIEGEGLQAIVGGNMTIEAETIVLRSHVVEQEQYTDEFTFGVRFFGSQAIDDLFRNQSMSTIAKSLLSEDPLISSLLNEDVGGAIVHGWNEAAKFARAFNSGNLKNAIGEHFGLTDSAGDFNLAYHFHAGALLSQSRIQRHLNSKLNVGNHLTIHTENLTLKGADVEANTADIIAKKAKIESQQDVFDEQQTSFSLSTSGNVSMHQGKSHSAQVHGVTGIKAIGTFKSDTLELKGASLQGMHVETAHFQHSDIENQENKTSIGVTLNVKALSNKTKEGISHLGNIDFKQSKQHGLTRATITEANGADFQSVNTQLDRVQEKEEEDTVHIQAPLIIPHLKQMQADLQDMKLALKPPSKQHRLEAQNINNNSLSRPVAKKEKHISKTKKPKVQVLLNTDNSDKQTQKIQLNEETPLLSPQEKLAPEKKPMQFDQLMNVWERNHKLDEMLDMRVMATAVKLLTYPIEKASDWTCQSHPEVQKVCQTLSKFIQGYNSHFLSLMTQSTKWICQTHPYAQKTCDTIEKSARSMINQWQQNVQIEAEFNEKQYSIPATMTRQYHQDIIHNTLFSMATVLKLPKAEFQKPPHPPYGKDAFMHPPKEFRGIFSKDVVVVHYHNEKTISRSWKWVIPEMQANQLNTIEKVKDAMSLLNKFGDHTHISVSKIPVAKRRKLVPEDIGIASKDFFQNKRNRLEGHVTLKEKGEVLKVKIDWISVDPEGSLGNWLTVISDLKNLAKANGANTLLFQAEIINHKLLDVMTKRYGTPKLIKPKSEYKGDEQQWRIVVKKE